MNCKEETINYRTRKLQDLPSIKGEEKPLYLESEGSITSTSIMERKSKSGLGKARELLGFVYLGKVLGI